MLSAAPGSTYRVLVPPHPPKLGNCESSRRMAGGPPFELLKLTQLRVPRPCALCKGGYDAVGSTGFDLSRSRSAASTQAGQLRKLQTYASVVPTLAKGARMGHPSRGDLGKNQRVGPPPFPDVFSWVSCHGDIACPI